jgi:prepilin-type N-terminal cleavage/methylation domain-containing protein
MSPQYPPPHNSGFTLLEVILGMAILAISALAYLGFINIMNGNISLGRTLSSQDRVLAGVRMFASMPAALRNSLRAVAPDGTALNKELYSCTTGFPAGSCNNGVSYPFTLYSPLLPMSPAGVPIGIQPITSPSGTPMGSPALLRIDTFGAPCSGASSACPLVVLTSFQPVCGPQPLPSPAPVPATAAQLVPMPKCTVADSIVVTFTVQIDPAYAKVLPGLAGFSTPITGTAISSVKDISGNSAQ